MTLTEARTLVFAQKPVFAKLYEQYKNRTWIEYANENFPKRDSSVATLFRNDTVRQQELLTTFQKVLTPLLSKEKVDGAVQTLKETRFVSTCDHHGVLCHPFFVNSALLRSREEHVTISLTCGGISLSNSSYPRGIFFHDKNLKEIRIPFLSQAHGNSPIYGHAPISREKISNRALGKNRLQDFIKIIVSTQTIWEQDRLSDQFTIINDILWDMIFDKKRGSLVYLESESLVRLLLLDIHLGADTFIHQILFDKTTRKSYVKNYDGISGAHTRVQKGTHFFWFIEPKKHTRVQLWVNGEMLTSADKKIQIKLTPNAIRDSLDQYELLPSMALCYSILSFYYGLTLGGGFSQVQYLGEMGVAYEKVRRRGEEGAEERMRRRGGEERGMVRTDIFTGEFVAIGLSNGEKSVPATLIDILLYGRGDINTIINQQCSNSTIGVSLDLMMPEFVHIITGTRPSIIDVPSSPNTFYVNN